MIKLVVAPALVALFLAWGASYFLTSAQGENAFEMYKLEVEKNIERRWEQICKEVNVHFPNSPELAGKAIENEIEKMRARKDRRRVENENH